MKKIFKYLFYSALILLIIFVIQNIPISSQPKPLPRLADTANIRKNLEAIINTGDYRNFSNVAVLDSVAAHIKNEFLKNTSRVTLQTYKVEGKSYSNVIASFGPENGERIIVGAHYDVCGNQDGADDNASGTAGLLELGRLLQTVTNLKYRIDLVAYTLEEPPFFRTENMGSYVHAKSLHDAKVDVKGMISLEMIGYFSDEENSQNYPVPGMGWFYGNKGNYITIVQKSVRGSFAKAFKKAAFENNSILTKSLVAPSFFAGIDLSDHRNYWKFGYSAVMITNTAFFRNKYYHTKGDQLYRLDVGRMGLVVDGIYKSLLAIE